jgi:hypothetical protein
MAADCPALASGDAHRCAGEHVDRDCTEQVANIARLRRGLAPVLAEANRYQTYARGFLEGPA